MIGFGLFASTVNKKYILSQTREGRRYKLVLKAIEKTALKAFHLSARCSRANKQTHSRTCM